MIPRREWLVLPISDIPARLREFALQFRSVFNHPRQQERFEEILIGLIASDNKTLAGIHQRLVKPTDYESLQHFMSNSPWSHDEMRKQRLEWVSKNLPREESGRKL